MLVLPVLGGFACIPATRPGGGGTGQPPPRSKGEVRGYGLIDATGVVSGSKARVDGYGLISARARPVARVDGYGLVDGTVRTRAPVVGYGTISATVAAVPVFTNGFRAQLELRLPLWASGAPSVTNFLLPVVEQRNDLKTVANGGLVQSSSGWDIRFETAGGTKLGHKIVAYDGATGKLIALVNFAWAMDAALSLFCYVGKAGLGATEEDATAARAGGWLAWFAGPSGTDLTGQGRTLTPTSISATTLGLWPAAEFVEPGRFTQASSSWLNGLAAITFVSLHQSDTTNEFRELMNVSVATAGELGLRYKDADRRIVANGQWGSSGYLIESANGAATTAAQAVAVSFAAGQTVQMVVDGVLTVPAVAPGTPTGTLAITDTLEWGRGERGSFNSWDGRGAFLGFCSTRLPAMQMAALTAALLDPRRVYGLGEANYVTDSNKSPVALPVRAAVSAGVATDINVAGSGYDQNADTLSVTDASVLTGSGTVSLPTTTQVRLTANTGVDQSLVIDFGLRDAGNKRSRGRLFAASTIAAVTANRSGLAWKSGVCMSDNLGNWFDQADDGSGNNSFRAWRGRRNDITICYTGGQIWGKGDSGASLKTATAYWTDIKNSNKLSDGSNSVQAFMNNGAHVVYAQAMLSQAERGDFASIEAGDRDADHVILATRIFNWINSKPASYPRLIMCFGQEFTVRGYPWAVLENTGAAINYRRAYKRVCRIYDKIINSGTNRRVWFSWNGTYSWTGLDLATVFPNATGDSGGTAYEGESLEGFMPLNYLTGDFYDNYSNGSPFSSDADFQTWAGNYTLTGSNGPTRGPRGMCRWAESKGLAFGIPEWFPSRNSGASPPENVNYTWYINGMYRMFTEMAARTYGGQMFEIGFNQTPDLLKHQLWPRTQAVTNQLENCSDEYRRLWRPA
jgi:hypothetical protein